jgi:hypothetical protein
MNYIYASEELLFSDITLMSYKIGSLIYEGPILFFSITHLDKINKDLKLRRRL